MNLGKPKAPPIKKDPKSDLKKPYARPDTRLMGVNSTNQPLKDHEGLLALKNQFEKEDR